MSQNSKNQGFSYYICFMIEGSGSIPWLMDPVPEGPKHVDPGDPVSDPNPEHWFLLSWSIKFCLFRWESRWQAWKVGWRIRSFPPGRQTPRAGQLLICRAQPAPSAAIRIRWKRLWSGAAALPGPVESPRDCRGRRRGRGRGWVWSWLPVQGGQQEAEPQPSAQLSVCSARRLGRSPSERRARGIRRCALFKESVPRRRRRYATCRSFDVPQGALPAGQLSVCGACRGWLQGNVANFFIFSATFVLEK